MNLAGIRSRRGRWRRPVAWLLVAVLAGCGAPVPTATAGPERCLELGAEVVGLAWSQTGRYLAVGTAGAEGTGAVRVLTAEGEPVAEPVSDEGLRPATVTVAADGRAAWIADRPNGAVLVEDRVDGRRETPLPAGVIAVSWTAVDFAILQRPAGGGGRVSMLDVDRPDQPVVIHETALSAERLWIAADPESFVLTIVHPDHRDTPASFQVVRATVTRDISPSGADASGASMPMLRRWVVYRSSTTGRMEAVRVREPDAPVTLSERTATRGMISDRGILAVAAAEQVGRLCLVDVGALVRP